MSKDIPIKEVIEDKNTWFNVKRFKVGKVDINRPEKTLDLKKTTRENYERYIKPAHSFDLFEISKKVSKFDKISAISENEDAENQDFFEWAKWREDKQTSLNFTFDFNPYNHIKKADDIDYFFDMYYGFSNPFLFVPNLKIKNNEGPMVDIESYLRFTDEVFDILNSKNSKPIFVPISIRMTGKEQDTLIEHYVKKEYFNYWFDFEGKSMTTVQLGKLRHFNKKIKDLGFFDKTVIYYTNINKIIADLSEEENNPASDILASLAGANIIGVNRKPQRNIKPIPGKPPYIYVPKPPEHRFRIFNKDSYYYVKSKTKTHQVEEINRDINAVMLDQEFGNQTNHFMKNYEIETYLTQKEMLNTFQDGALLKRLTQPKNKTKK
jgi:hypothetical protein